MSVRAVALTLTVAILALSGLAFIPAGSPTAAATAPNTPFSWNPKVPCTPLVIRITDITANQTGSASFSTSQFSPGTTPPVSGGNSKRWLTPGATPPGWIAPGPPCTVTNSKGTKSLFVEIDGLQRSSLTNEDWSNLYDPANGGTPHIILTGDTTFNLFDPSVVPDYSTSCSSMSDPTCYGRIHAEIDHDWKATGYCGTGTVCDNATLASQTAPASTLIDVQGFVYWDPGAIGTDWHQFNGWEIHPLTAWKPSSTPPPTPFSVSVSPSTPQVGGTVSFSATPSNGTNASSFSWDFGDGVTASGNSVSHMYVTAQAFTVYVTMTDNLARSYTTWRIIPVGSWNSAVACAPVLTTLEDVLGGVSIQRDPSNSGSMGADYSGGGFQLDGSLPYGSNPSTWPFFRRDLRPPCNVSGTSAFVEFHNVTVIDVSRNENCGTTYQNGTSYSNSWQSCDTTFSLVTPGWGDDACPACYMHRVYAGIDRDWNASGIAPPTLSEGQRINVQGFVFWNDANINATWHSYSGWEIHPVSSWQITYLPITAGISFSPTDPTTTQTVTFNGTGSGGVGPYTFNWDFGDGTVTTGSTANHIYGPGNYTVHMSAEDSQGIIGIASQNITLRIPPDFTLSIGPSSVAFLAGSSVRASLNLSSIHSFSGEVALTALTSPGITGSFDPTNVTLLPEDSAVSILTFSSLTPGVYNATVTASSGLLSHSSIITVTVVDVGPSIGFSETTSVAFRGQTITMTISASDIDGTVTTLRVDWADGTIDILPGNSNTDSHAYSGAGVFTVNVTATDNAGLSSSATTVNTITDAPPIAEFTESSATVPTGTLISFNGSTSSDPDGTIVAYSWDFGDGSTASGPEATHSYSLAGDYTVTLTVTDNVTLAASATSNVHVTDRPPIVSFTISTTSSPSGTPITLAINATDPDGTVTNITVVWGDGSMDSLPGNASVTHSFSLAGSYNVYVNATDNSGLTTTSDVTNLTIADRPPVVNFTESTTSSPTGTPITITISASDADGIITRIMVNWGDGTIDSLTGNVTSDIHSYSLACLCNITVTATDDAGLSEIFQATITVTNRPPTVSFTETATTAPTGTLITLTISASDPDGTVSQVQVSWGDGTIDMLPGNSDTDSHAYALAGTFTVNVTATDNEGVSTSVNAVNTILDAPPTVSLTANLTDTDTGQTVTLTISSQDSDGTIAQTVVNWGDGAVDTLPGAATTDSHVYRSTGDAKSATFIISVTVTDDATLTATSTVLVMVHDLPPTVSFTSSTTSALTGVSISFNATASNDSDGSLTSYFWNFGDGSNATGAVVSHSYTDTGNSTSKAFNVTLTVTDNSDNTATTGLVETIIDRNPVASFTQSTQAALTGTSITFNATESIDPDGSVLTYSWSFGDGDHASGVVVAHSYSATGSSLSQVFTVSLTIVDNSGNTNSASSEVAVNDRPPTPSFTQSTSSTLTLVSVGFNASSSIDPDGTILSYTWNFGDGNTETGITVNHTYANTGNSLTQTFTVTLTVTDNSGDSGTASGSVIVVDRPPNATFAATMQVAQTLTSIIFVATGSSDPDGTITSYSWSFGDGGTALGPVVSHSYTNTGDSMTKNYTVTLTVRDNSGNTATAQSIETITDRPPTASFTESTLSTTTGSTITFSAAASTDPDGTITNYSWNFGDGSTATGQNVTHSYTSTGSTQTATFIVTLTVTDNSGNSGSSSATLTISDVEPAASFTTTPSTGLTGISFSFNATSSTDPDGAVTSYSWNFGDDTTGAGTVTTHSYAGTGGGITGTFTVTLTVTDNAGSTSNATGFVTVTDRPPSARFDASSSSAYTGAGVTFNATSSNDVDGTIATYSWSFGDDNNGTGKVVMHSYAIAGNYTVQLTVTDDCGSHDSATFTVLILDRPPLPVLSSSLTTSLTLNNIDFNATGSSDPDGTIVGFAWNFGDGSTGLGIVVSHSFAKAGNYTVVLGVTDNNGMVAFDSIQEIILDRAPTASFTYTPGSTLTGQAVSFDASSSIDLDGTIVGFSWTFGDGTTAAGANIMHTYTTNGTFIISLTITDDNGSMASVVSAITVGDDPAPTWPSGSYLMSPRPGPRSVELVWSPATDSVRVTDYRIFVNGTLWATVSGNTTNYDVTGLNPLSEYVFQVQAGNPSQNWSIDGPSVSAFTHLIGDVNQDCAVNGIDLAILGSAFLTTPANPNYKPSADLNNDSVINGIDLAILGANFLQTC